MKYLTSAAIISVLFIFVISGCKKEEETTPDVTPTISKTQLLTAKVWKKTAWTVSPALNGITNMYSMLIECVRDNLDKYNTNNTYSFEEGATVCNTGDPQIRETGTWAFNSGETALLTTSSIGLLKSRNIVSLSSTTLVISYIDDFDDNIDYTFTETYTAQ